MKDVRMAYYVEKMKELHPLLGEKNIKKIINQGFHNIMNELKDGHNIKIESGRKKVKFQIYEYVPFKVAKAKLDAKEFAKHF